MKIKYKAYTQNGEKVSGILDTESEQIAYNILEKKQLLPYHIEEIENKNVVPFWLGAPLDAVIGRRYWFACTEASTRKQTAALRMPATNRNARAAQ